MFDLSFSLTILLIFCLLAACAFEFINGFHDTANAVATVIYTHSLKPRTAVIWSGIWNFIGVYFGGIAVAMGILNLLPLDALIDQNISHNIALVIALILTAIIWNLGTWYLGIPCSSSHTLIGSIFGVGLGLLVINGGENIALNWKKIGDAGLSLIISPVFGFLATILLMFVLKTFIKKKKFYKEPHAKKAPPFWIRSILVITCTSVSFSHGSNDGQKGVGLIMIILIAIVPTYFALDKSKNFDLMINNVQYIEKYMDKVDKNSLSFEDQKKLSEIHIKIDTLKSILKNSGELDSKPSKKNFEVRKDILIISRHVQSIISCKSCSDCSCLNLNKKEIDHLKQNINELKSYTEYAPWWVFLMISLSLGIGTMIGWKRIVVTIGEKIGKTHLSYAQGASAEIIAASTIAVSTNLGLPVSTTHVLSSGIAGSMVASDGVQNLQPKTIKNIGIAWLITIPVTVLLAFSLFLFLRWII